MVYSLGQRTIFFFPITAMWLLGPTAMIIASVIVTSAVMLLDRWNPNAPEKHTAPALRAALEKPPTPPPPTPPPAEQKPPATASMAKAVQGGGAAEDDVAIVMTSNPLGARKSSEDQNAMHAAGWQRSGLDLPSPHDGSHTSDDSQKASRMAQLRVKVRGDQGQDSVDDEAMYSDEGSEIFRTASEAPARHM
jgi:hypothetical protein